LLQQTLGLTLILLLLTGCGGAPVTPTPEIVSASDVAVCDAYQQLVDAWPTETSEIPAGVSADELWEAITNAVETLVTASEAADTAELGEAGQQLGEIVARDVDFMSAPVIELGFIPFR